MSGGEDHGLTDAEKHAVDEFWKQNAPQLATAAKQLSWPGGLARREALAAAAEDGRKAQGFLTKDTFDEILALSDQKNLGVYDSRRGRP